jgi:hypothetical protein
MGDPSGGGDMFESVCSIFAAEAFRGAVLTIGVIVAIASIRASRELARKKQAADLLFHSRTDVELQAGHAVIRKYASAADKNIRTLAESDQYETQDAKAVRYLLNHLEVVSVGVQSKIFDEKMLKDCWGNLVVHTYDLAQPLINELQKKQPSGTVLQELAWLAIRWKADPLKKKGRG